LLLFIILKYIIVGMPETHSWRDTCCCYTIELVWGSIKYFMRCTTAHEWSFNEAFLFHCVLVWVRTDV